MSEISLVDIHYTDFCVRKVFRVHFTDEFSGISDLVHIIKAHITTDVTFRLSIDQEGCDSIVLPSIHYKELNSTLLKNLLVEEQQDVNKDCMVTVIIRA